MGETLVASEMIAQDEPGGLSKDEIAASVVSMLEAAQNHATNTLQPFRTQATEYYLGRPFGNETEGRSQFIATEVRDTVQAMLPSLMKVFFGGERVVEFRPRTAQGVAAAEQATEYINYLVTDANPGFLVLYSAFKDAMIRRLGIVKYWWEPGTDEVEEYLLTGLSEPQLAALQADAEVVGGDVVGTTQQPDGSNLYDVQVKHRRNHPGCAKIAALPPEEFVCSPNARSLDEALLVAHVTRQRRGDLLAMGFDPADLDEAGTAKMLVPSQEEQARQPGGVLASEQGREETDWVKYAEVYCYLDEDGDGVAEHRRIVVLGERTVARDEAFTGRPFALFSTDPEPHTLIGLSVADNAMDLQLVKSAVMRAMLDSLGQTVNPRTWAVEGAVNIRDLMNPEIGAVVRVKAPGMIGELVQPFVGKEAFPLLTYLDEVKENRTGISKASMGLNPDALQSSTRAAVAATVTASQQHLELIARIFAETGFRQLFAGLLRLVVQYQDRPTVARLRGQYTEIDPRPWDATMEVTILLSMGAGTVEDRMAALTAIAAKQEAILQLLGPSNPLVGIPQYRETLARMTELAGFKDPSKFWAIIPPDYQPPPPQDKPSPEEVYAQAEAQKVAGDIQHKQQLLLAQEREMGVKTQLESARIEIDRLKAQADADATLQKVALEQQRAGFDQQHALSQHELEQLKLVTEREKMVADHAPDPMRISLSISTAPLTLKQTRALLAREGIDIPEDTPDVPPARPVAAVPPKPGA